MHGLRNGLRCIIHPSSIIAILVLVLNDHILKQHFPGFLSGKISDFAGLYFFPFLISLPISISHLKAPRLGLVSFLLTGLLFILIKTIPWVNSFLENGLSQSLGLAFQFSLDPTDLLALLSLIPAWRLWSRNKESHTRSLAWAVVIVASVATLATSIVPEESITKLSFQHGVIYAYSPEYGGVNASYDFGSTWQYVDSAPAEVKEELEKAVIFPKVVCDTKQPLACFRISELKAIECSDDGGDSWLTVWEIPLDRRDFMTRFRGSTEFGPYDIVLVNDDVRSFVIAAMGNQGILIGYQDGTWIRKSVGSAYPTPLYLTEPSHIVRLLDPEISILSSASILAYIMLLRLYWKSVLSIPEGSHGEDLWKGIFRPVRIGTILGFLSLIFILPELMLSLVNLIIWPFMLLFLLGPFLGSLISWKRIYSFIPRNTRLGIASIAIIFTGYSPLVLGSIPLILWAVGLIGKYLVALLLSIIISSSTLLIGFYAILKRAKDIKLNANNFEDI